MKNKIKDLITVSNNSKSVDYYIGTCNIDFSEHITQTLKSSFLSYEGGLGFEKSAWFELENGIQVILTTIETSPKYQIIDGVRRADTTISVYERTISYEMIDAEYYKTDMVGDIIKALKLENIATVVNNTSLEEVLLLRRSLQK